MTNEVKSWIEEVSIPTYGTGKPEKNPIFLEKRVYQGSSGVVYPHPVIEKIEDEKQDKIYQAIYIENQYLKITILPELGGRVQRAYDKVKNRDFIYYNQVVKPALVGLTGPWISGGIEFNWPQHHRPSTFMPIDHMIHNNDDGSVTVWVNEVEEMFRTKGMTGFTVYPDKAYLELKVRFYNPTPFPQTFLWWANPAVKVNDHYQSVFPPDVHAVFDHGKRDVSDFPIATGIYYHVDYGPGTDISMYKNIPVPTSYMAVASEYDFIGCYEHDMQAGMLHVANHHISTGKKQWTWGNGDFGKAWDRNLTDEDGPYIELMCGAFTDNQPDFSWLQPGENKDFEEYFMPYADVGMVKNATKEAAINIELSGKVLDIRVYATARYDDAQVVVYLNSEVAHDYTVDLSPENTFLEKFKFSSDVDPESIKVSVYTNDKMLLVEYQQKPLENKETPSAAQAAKHPSDVESVELLYLNGLHLEQYRHATYSPMDYYLEGIKRDSGDSKCNTAIGLIHLRKGEAIQAESYFRKAIERLTLRNPNPYDGEALYYLGQSLLIQGKLNEAYKYYYKATWNEAWQGAAFTQLAKISCINGQYEEAKQAAEKALLKGYHNHSVRHILTYINGKLGENHLKLELINDSLVLDPFNLGCIYEKYKFYLAQNKHKEADSTIKHFFEISRNTYNNVIECCIAYMHVGAFKDAYDILKMHIELHEKTSPLAYYYLGYFAEKHGLKVESVHAFESGSKKSADLCFPHKVEDMTVLNAALAYNTNDSKAHYYLGNYWYSKRSYETAINHWEASIKIDDSFPTAHRNLALAYYNKLHKYDDSQSSLERAFELDTTDSRVLMELDQLYKIRNNSPENRLHLLETHKNLVQERDDLYLEYVTLLNYYGRYEEAEVLLDRRQFHPWEGGEGKVVGQYILAKIQLAKQAMRNGQNSEALTYLNATEDYPYNLGEGKLAGTQENDIHFLKGCAYEALGMESKAQEFFNLGTFGISQPAQAIFYNDPQPDKIFYQGLCRLKLGKVNESKEIFQRLLDFGNNHMNDVVTIDYFAVSLPDLQVFDQDLDLKNNLHCKYMAGMGLLGLGRNDEAEKLFDEVLSQDAYHQGARIHKDFISVMVELV